VVVSGSSSKIRWLSLIGGSGFVVWGVTWGIAYGLHYGEGRVKPTKEFEVTGAAHSSLPISREAQRGEDPALAALRSEAESKGSDARAWKSLGEALMKKMSSSSNQEVDQGLVLEAIDSFLKAVQGDPKDSSSYLALADLSFERRVFDQSLNFYRKYLELEPGDGLARGRYASALTFLGKFDESIKELEFLLSQNTKDFQALAYLSIAYAQKGENNRARTYAQQALEVAPQEEARQRLLKYMESLPGQKVSALPPPPSSESLRTFEAAIRRHPIAGSKIAGVTLEESDKKVMVSVKDFPMEAMPPFARKKFFETLFSYPEASGLEEIIFIDEASKRELAREKRE
jgi:tetratricopeptide (TPR) repeat protein